MAVISCLPLRNPYYFRTVALEDQQAVFFEVCVYLAGSRTTNIHSDRLNGISGLFCSTQETPNDRQMVSYQLLNNLFQSC